MNGSLSMFYITDEMTYTASRMPDGLYGIITGHAGTGKTSRNGTDTHAGIATIICMPIRMPPSTSTTTTLPGSRSQGWLQSISRMECHRQTGDGVCGENAHAQASGLS